MALLRILLSNPIMTYYDDIQFTWGDIQPDCRTVVDAGWPHLCNLQLKTGGEMYFGVDGGAREMFGPQEALLFWHHPRHRFQYGPGDCGFWEHHWVTFRGSRALRLMEQGFMELSADFRLRIADAEPMRVLFSRLVSTVCSPELEAQRKAAEGLVLLERVLNLALEEKHRRRSALPSSPQRLARVEQTLREEAHRATDVYALARQAGFSEAHFRRLFRAHYGQSPHQYLLHLVMQRAARQLVFTDQPVAIIGAESGYEDPAQFSKAFRKQMSLSPQQWRQSHRLSRPER